MTLAANQSTPESRAAALAMFEHQVPCFAQHTEAGCEQTAKWLAFFAHEESQPCGFDEPLPACDEHQRLLQQVSSPFWRVWYQMEPILCGGCGKPIRLDRFEAI